MSKKNRNNKKVRVDFRRNMQNPARKSSIHWTKQVKEGEEAIEDTALQESLMGRGELVRKRTVDVQRAGSLLDLQHAAEAVAEPSEKWRGGTVTAIHGQFIKVDDGEKVRNCVIRRVLKSLAIDQHNPVAVGDHVDFTPMEPDEGVIERVGERKGMLYRRYQHKEHLVVANVDQILIIASVSKPELRIHLVDRYVIAALMEGLLPVIIFNKIDMPTREPLDDYERVYRSLGYKVLRTSAVTGEGIETLREVMKDRKSSVAGVSGVGKSSLINAVQSGLSLATRPINKTTGRGVHTTTMIQLLKLDFGGYIVDTPGIRQFALFKIDRAELDGYFADFRPYLGKCRFPNCTHLQEPDCAVKAAVETGEISDWRYDSYVKLYNDQEEFFEPWQR